MKEFNHKHSLGQNFLNDKKVLLNIIDSVDINNDDLIIEIGPGQGALTKYLKLFKCNLLCYEIDTRVAPYLKVYEDDNTKIIYDDFLKRDVLNDIKDINYKNLYIVANLPYYITTPIITKVIDDKLDVKEMVLMVQNEVANRLSAKPGNSEYGYITVLLNYYYDVKKLFFVNRKSFTPVPNVDSAVIKLSKANNREVKDFKLFDRLIKDSFRMKRKNIKNNLINYDLNVIENILSKYNLTLQNRAEEISLDCFIDIVNCLGDKND